MRQRCPSLAAAVVFVLLACTGSGTASAPLPPPSATPTCESPCHQIGVRLGTDRYEPPVTCSNPGRIRLVIENRSEQSEEVSISGPGLFQRLPVIGPGQTRMWENTLSGGSYVVGERQPRDLAKPRTAILVLKLDCNAPL